MLPQEIWDGCKKELEKRMGHSQYASYIEPARISEYQNGELTILVPSSFVADWIEKNHLSAIARFIDEKTAKKNRIKFAVDSAPQKKVKAPAPVVMKKKKQASSAPQFKPQYSFESFVVGKSNEFAYASALQCAKNPGTKYNPLFLYGGVGLGKTHLMQAIGRYITEKKPSAKVMFLSSEQFVNKMISAIQKGQMERFRNRFRNLDVLLVDDIQFIAGKDRTQEEFFHTFNSLFESEKQIVVSSDQFPKEIKKLEERLKSRFEWGLIADIQPADLETKMAIINKKAQLNGYKIPADVAEYLARTVTSNIRELEGCMARVVAYASLSKRSINLELAMETMDGVYSEAKKHIDIPMIQKSVAEYFSMRISELKSKKRTKRIVVPRQIAMFLCREYTDESLPEIGKSFGGRDHSTVIHAHQKIRKDVEVNTRIYNDLTKIKKSLGL